MRTLYSHQQNSLDGRYHRRVFFLFIELRNASWMSNTLEDAIFKGFYPRIYSAEISPVDYYPNYFETYLQRDVRLLSAVQDLVLFRKFDTSFGRACRL